MAPDMRQALDERRNLIEQRARSLADEAIRGKAPWTRALGPRPADRALRARWDEAAITAAAYRDRYGIEGRTLLGPKPATDSQCLDRARALAALRRAEPEAAVVTRSDPVPAIRL